MAALATLRHHSTIPGQDGNDCKIWLNPGSAELAAALQRAIPDGVPILRGLLSETGLFVWHGACLRHADFERATGMDGIRLQLGYGSILVHEDVLTLAVLPWAGDEGIDLDVEERRAAVAGYSGYACACGHDLTRPEPPSAGTLNSPAQATSCLSPVFNAVF